MTIQRTLMHRPMILLFLAGLVFLLPFTASAADTITIDPVPANPEAGSIVTITGTTLLPEGTDLDYEFFSEDPGTGAVRYGEHSGVEGTIPVQEGSAGRVWTVGILTEGYFPGEYIFRIGSRGTDETVFAHVVLARGTPAIAPEPSPAAGPPQIASPYYSSPGAEFDVEIRPDLSARQNRVAKGSTLEVTGTATPGSGIGIWILGGFPADGYRTSATVPAEDSGAFHFVLPGNDTATLRSGQYFLYVVDGGAGLVEPGDPEAFPSADAFEKGLTAHEQENPYKAFMLLLEEPAIRIGEIPESRTGVPLEIGGTTNLAAGTILTLDLIPPDADRLQQPAFTLPGIVVGDGEGGSGVWHASVETASLPPGEYVAKVSGGRAEATAILNLYDDLYRVASPPEGDLTVATYRVDPGTKTVDTGPAPDGKGIPSSAATLAIAGIAGFAGITVIAVTLRKR